jgi:hypothetical protein
MLMNRERAVESLGDSIRARYRMRVTVGSGTDMFFVVGLTLDDVWSGSLPQLRLAAVLEERAKQVKYPPEPPRHVAVYTTDPNDAQVLVARTKYKEKGSFLAFLYFSDAAVQICKEVGIPLRIVDEIDERELPAKKVKVLEHPAVASALK